MLRDLSSPILVHHLSIRPLSLERLFQARPVISSAFIFHRLETEAFYLDFYAPEQIGAKFAHNVILSFDGMHQVSPDAFLPSFAYPNDRFYV
jgi:hypothetical protein